MTGLGWIGWLGAFTHLQHVQQGRLSSVVEAEEQQLRVLVEQAEGGQDIVDCTTTAGEIPNVSDALLCYAMLPNTPLTQPWHGTTGLVAGATGMRLLACLPAWHGQTETGTERAAGWDREKEVDNIHQLIIHMLTDLASCERSVPDVWKRQTEGKKGRG